MLNLKAQYCYWQEKCLQGQSSSTLSQYHVYKYIEGTSNYVALDIDKYDMHRQHRLVAITITLLIGKL
jgi:predicted RNA-binding protein Jag